jgi:hypothetical protein
MEDAIKILSFNLAWTQLTQPNARRQLKLMQEMKYKKPSNNTQQSVDVNFVLGQLLQIIMVLSNDIVINKYTSNVHIGILSSRYSSKQ